MAKSNKTSEECYNLPYFSCIRIHGMRILPPIMTDEKRQRMQYYKDLALKVEKEIKSRPSPTKIVSDYTDEYAESNSSSFCDSSYTSEEETTQIFTESCRSDVLNMLNDKKPAISNVPLPESDKDVVQLIPEKPNVDSSSILYEIGAGDNTKISEVKENDIKVIENVVETPEKDQMCIETKEDMTKTPENKQLTHCLIRSNSYVLESPSPYLLALIKQNTDTNETKTCEQTKKRRTWDLEKAKQKWSSIENDLNTKNFECKRTESYNSLPNSPSGSPEPEKDTSPSKIFSIIKGKSKSEILSPKNRKTDLIIRKPTSSFQIILPKKPEILPVTNEQQIKEIIDRIHDEQSKQMTELIARQKREQENLMKLFAEQQSIVLSKLKTLQETVESKHDLQLSDISEPEILKNSEMLLSECKKILQQEISSSSCDDIINHNFSRNSNDDTICSELTITPEPRSNLSSDFYSKFDVNYSKINNSLESENNEIITIQNGVSHKNSSKKMCSRQLFPTKRQIWAATVIQSAVRGYFVRRLLNTEKVQNFVKTIRDTLMCAVELHHETLERIQPADVELHRRLILQVNAACHAFHDIFFEISHSDQLQIIASDRERLKEKLLRPQLSRNSSLTSTTQRVLERKLHRRSSDSLASSQSVSRCSSSRSCYSVNDYRTRTKSLGLSDSVEKRKTSPQNEMMRRAMSVGANKKPWR